jgi:hypothetical protein
VQEKKRETQMFTLTETDEATSNARLLTADEIDLVAGGVLFASTTANGCPGIAIPFLPGHLSFAYSGTRSLFLSGRLFFANAGVTIPALQGHLSIVESDHGEAVALAVPGYGFSSAISWS